MTPCGVTKLLCNNCCHTQSAALKSGTKNNPAGLSFKRSLLFSLLQLFYYHKGIMPQNENYTLLTDGSPSLAACLNHAPVCAM